MVGIDGPAVLIVLLIALGYFTVDVVKEPIKKTGHTICHAVTFGHKCKNDKPQP